MPSELLYFHFEKSGLPLTEVHKIYFIEICRVIYFLFMIMNALLNKFSLNSYLEHSINPEPRIIKTELGNNKRNDGKSGSLRTSWCIYQTYLS